MWRVRRVEVEHGTWFFVSVSLAMLLSSSALMFWLQQRLAQLPHSIQARPMWPSRLTAAQSTGSSALVIAWTCFAGLAKAGTGWPRDFSAVLLVYVLGSLVAFRSGSCIGNACGLFVGLLAACGVFDDVARRPYWAAIWVFFIGALLSLSAADRSALLGDMLPETDGQPRPRGAAWLPVSPFVDYVDLGPCAAELDPDALRIHPISLVDTLRRPPSAAGSAESAWASRLLRLLPLFPSPRAAPGQWSGDVESPADQPAVGAPFFNAPDAMLQEAIRRSAVDAGGMAGGDAGGVAAGSLQPAP